MSSLPVHWFSNSTGWMTGHIIQEYIKHTLVHELKEYCTSQGLPFCILMVLDNAPAHPHVLQNLHQDIKFIYLPANTTSLLQPMEQGVIKMFKAHYLQKSWRSLSMKCDGSLNKLEKAAQLLRRLRWNFRKTCCGVIESPTPFLTQFGMSEMSGKRCGVLHPWKKLCQELTIDFRGFDLSERLLEEHLKCLELAKRVSLDEPEEDIDSLLESIGKELDELEKQWLQLEKEVEAEQHPTMPSTTKQLTVMICCASSG